MNKLIKLSPIDAVAENIILFVKLDPATLKTEVYCTGSMKCPSSYTFDETIRLLSDCVVVAKNVAVARKAVMFISQNPATHDVTVVLLGNLSVKSDFTLNELLAKFDG